MDIAKRCIMIMLFLVLTSSDAFTYDYTWNDYRQPFTQFVGVPPYTSGTSTVYLDLPRDAINSAESITLRLDIESNSTIDIIKKKSFYGFSAYCSVNGAGFFGKHRIRVNELPARQTCSIVIRTKDLKAARNTFEFSMSPTDNTMGQWRCLEGKTCIAYGIHKMWFEDFSHTPETRLTDKTTAAAHAEPGIREIWDGKAISISEFSARGHKCGETIFTLYVSDSKVSGTASHSSGTVFDVSGSVDANGAIHVGTAASEGGDFVIFTGDISGNSAKGIWQERWNCYGTWTATKKVEPTNKQRDTEIQTKLIELKQLLEKGLINEDDYSRKKAELLDRF